MGFRTRTLRGLFVVTAIGLLTSTYSSAAAVESRIPFRAGTKYLEVREKDGSYKPIFVKGMNLSCALPGHHPSEFPRDEKLYRSWIDGIADMNCNTIRVYTIVPPDFYKALRSHNLENPDKQLYLIQGVWVEPPPGGNFLDDSFKKEVELNVRNAVNLVHGNANFDERPGWTGGRYTADVSPWLLAWLLGREWEPNDIETFHKVRPDYLEHKGEMISCKSAEPIENWMAYLCDFCVTQEDHLYHVQRPCTFSSWPSTDPLVHESESNIEEEGDLAGSETKSRTEIFSSDSVNISASSFTVEPAYKAGLYASYHVYPYWPDFLDNEAMYTKATDRFGASNYYGYLADLKSVYPNMPLLIAEYGLPNGPIPCHQQNQGLSHGGLTEQQVGDGMQRMTYDIYDTGCAGGIVFAWIDEWFKKTWMWAEFYNPFMDRRLWYNLYDPEKNYGMTAIHPGADGPNNSLTGKDADWAGASLRPGVSVAAVEGAPTIAGVSLMHDEGFLHVRIKLDNYNDWDFKDHGLYLGFDVLGDKLGNVQWPGPLSLESDSGLEEVVSFTSSEARLWQTETWRFWQPYRIYGDVKPRIAEVFPHILEEENNRWAWFEPEVETNRRRVGRDGTVYPARFYALNPLPKGTAVQGPGFNDWAVWNVSPGSKVIELRMPWILLGFVGPHQMRVLQADPNDQSNSSVVSEGVGVAVAVVSAAGKLEAAYPGLDGNKVLTSASGRYTWPEWKAEEIKYHTYLKPVYYKLKDLFGRIEQSPPQPGTFSRQ